MDALVFENFRDEGVFAWKHEKLLVFFRYCGKANVYGKT